MITYHTITKYKIKQRSIRHIVLNNMYNFSLYSINDIYARLHLCSCLCLTSVSLINIRKTLRSRVRGRVRNC